ncbi:MAG: coenzyme F420-0:L-glutamate ligase [Candidatus Bathyarchaeota archaeon]|jgi:coenzyme F420-0:L-glutamate ligase|nr:coenzyme F420-0:L-glutamate ligase [Candidatus Bathyarchaeota archaeon A05DMB-5]MDH7557387.1 coenzyme F420-0:L-glutamate ligase [Candidatus Bathyarchaeota archaeon]
MRLYAIKIELVKTGDNLVDITLEALKKQNLELEDNDVLAITSKILSYAQNRLVNLNDIKPSEKAKKLAKRFSLQPEFAELVLREADKIYGGVEKAVLTLKNGVLTANAGIDNKNAPKNHVVLWPKNPQEWAKNVKEEIMRRTGKQVAVLIVDSGLAPLRKGTEGLALAVAGFKPVIDRRGEKDVYGKPLVITHHAVADDLASAAHLLMGEVSEKTPIVLIKDAPVEFNDNVYNSTEMMMPFKECIFMNVFKCSK